MRRGGGCWGGAVSERSASAQPRQSDHVQELPYQPNPMLMAAVRNGGPKRVIVHNPPFA